jgi:glycosyltransferase involved in cell wall biosynthesis
MEISVISTVRNEEDSIERLIDSLLKQSLSPQEIVIVDGGSTDKTWQILQKLAKKISKLIIIQSNGANISKGRNLAIEKAKGEIIAVTDAGCKIDRDWLKNLIIPIQKKEAEVSCGFFKPDASSFYERVLSAVTIPILNEIKEEKFLPSSRSVAFLKSVWEAVKGYPEWLPICEDLVFDIKLKKLPTQFVFTPNAIVSWKPRSTLYKFYRQYFLYARGDGHAKLFLKRHIIRYSTYIFLIILLLLSFFISSYYFLLIILGGIVYMAKYINRFLYHFPNRSISEYLKAFITIPLFVFVGDLGKMIGYPIGIKQRLQGQIHFHPY